MLWLLRRVSSSSSSTPKPGARRTRVAPMKPPRRTTIKIFPTSLASLRSVFSSPTTRWQLLVRQFCQVTVVVKHGGVVHEFQNVVHAVTIFPAHIVELD